MPAASALDLSRSCPGPMSAKRMMISPDDETITFLYGESNPGHVAYCDHDTVVAHGVECKREPEMLRGLRRR
jgi:hypothetical protein